MSTRAFRNFRGALWDPIVSPITARSSKPLRKGHSTLHSLAHPWAGDHDDTHVLVRRRSVVIAPAAATQWRLSTHAQLHSRSVIEYTSTSSSAAYPLCRGSRTGITPWQGVPGQMVAGARLLTAAGVDTCADVTGDSPLGCSHCGHIRTPTKGLNKSILALLAAGPRKKPSTTRQGRLRPSMSIRKALMSTRHIASSGSKSRRGGALGVFAMGGLAGGGVPAGGGRNGNRGSPKGGDGNANRKPKTSPPKPSTSDSGILGRIAQVHRPTKDQMLAAANGMFERLRIRTKWALIRQMRPYNLEDIAALLQWLLVGHIIWIVVGTTTFFSIVLLLVNTVYAQERLATMIGNYFTKETGVRIVFESAIVPRWKDGRISLKNVFASRRPGNLKDKSNKNVRKGSSATAAAIAAAAVHADEAANRSLEEDEEEDTNYTQFDVTIGEVAVTLSLARWMNGKGLLKDVQVNGVRGVVDRTHVQWDEDVDPRSYRHVHYPGDFAIESFKLEDLLVTVHEAGFRPFSVSIYNCDLPQLRKQWLFYDFLSANNMSGSYDESLFTIHPRQSHGVSPSQQVLSPHTSAESKTHWKKISRLRIDGLKIDHLNRGVEGPFGWIEKGNVDIVADILFPEDDDGLVFSKVVQEIVDRVEKTVSSTSSQQGEVNSVVESARAFLQSLTQSPPPPTPSIRLPQNPSPTSTPNSISNSSTPSSASTSQDSSATSNAEDNRFIVLDLHIQLSNVLAAVPLFTKDLSYVNSALVRPIVAYINSRQTSIPINCRVVKRMSEFDGSWTVYDSGLMDDLSASTYEAFAAHVMDRQARRRRFRKVGLWSLQLIAQAVLMAMAGNLA